MGNEHAFKLCGNLLLKIKVKPHEYYRNEGKDIHTDNKITISQAILGGILEVNTLYGKQNISIRPGTQPGAIYKIPKCGMDKSSLHKSKGNHYVHIVIDIPTQLNNEQKMLMEKYSYHEDPIPPVDIVNSENKK